MFNPKEDYPILRLKQEEVLCLLQDLVDGKKHLVISAQMHHTDGFYKDRETKTEIWFKYFPPNGLIVCQRFKLYGVDNRLLNYSPTQPKVNAFTETLNFLHDEIQKRFNNS